MQSRDETTWHPPILSAVVLIAANTATFIAVLTFLWDTVICLLLQFHTWSWPTSHWELHGRHKDSWQLHTAGAAGAARTDVRRRCHWQQLTRQVKAGMKTGVSCGKCTLVRYLQPLLLRQQKQRVVRPADLGTDC